MDCNGTILKLEAGLLITRATTWMNKNIGGEQVLFKKLCSQPSQQQVSIDTCLRFVSVIIAASDLAGDGSNNHRSWMKLMARCSHLLEIMANSVYITPHEHTFIMDARSRLNCILRLSRFVNSTEYLRALHNGDRDLLNNYYILKLGAPTLHLWGEALLSFAETSLKYWKAQYMLCLKLAEERFASSLVVSPKRPFTCYLYGNTLLLRAKAEDKSSGNAYVILERAREAYASSVQQFPTVKEYAYALAQVCALLNYEAECQRWLKTFISLNPRGNFSLLDEPDFDACRSKKWFYDLVELVPGKSKQTGPTGDKQYNILQSSLIESGFSMKKLLEIFNWLPVSTGQSVIFPVEEENEYVKKQKQRLQERLELYQLKPRRDIPGDGNCQMYAVSDQMYDRIDKSVEIRKNTVVWLRNHRDWELPNGAILHQFVHDRPWEEYCDAMAKDGCWGDHLTLLAISELFGVVISILSSVEGDNFITEIHPTAKKMEKVLMLSHYAEFHYGSLVHMVEQPAVTCK